MLDSVASKVLRYLRANPACKRPEPLARLLHRSVSDVFATLTHLQNLGLLTFRRYIDDSFSFTLTHDGKNYHQRRRAEVKDMLLRSIVLPVIVSAVTTLLTLWLKSLF